MRHVRIAFLLLVVMSICLVQPLDARILNLEEVFLDVTGELEQTWVTFACRKSNPVTLSTQLVYQQGEESVWLGAFLSSVESASPLLGIKWVAGRGGFFPMWQLELVQGGYVQRLANTKLPKSNHVYQADLSYHPIGGALSFSLVDLTDQDIVFSGEIDVEPYDGSLVPIVGSKTHVHSFSVRLAGISSYYLPVGAKWKVMQNRAGNMLETETLDRRLDTVIMLNTGWPHLLKGTFSGRVEDYLLFDRAVLGREPQPISIQKFDAGVNSIVLEYVVDEQPLLSIELPVEIIYGRARLSFPAICGRDTVTGTMRIEGSDGPLGEVLVTIEADYSKVFVRNGITRGESVQSVKIYEERLVLDQAVEMIPFEFSMPSFDILAGLPSTDEGLAEVEVMRVQLRPSIEGVQTHIVGTYPTGDFIRIKKD